jgi:hypothetical protein
VTTGRAPQPRRPGWPGRASSGGEGHRYAWPGAQHRHGTGMHRHRRGRLLPASALCRRSKITSPFGLGIMPDHAGDRGTVSSVLEPHDHRHIGHERAFTLPSENAARQISLFGAMWSWPSWRPSSSSLAALRRPDPGSPGTWRPTRPGCGRCGRGMTARIRRERSVRKNATTVAPRARCVRCLGLPHLPRAGGPARSGAGPEGWCPRRAGCAARSGRRAPRPGP